MISTLTYLSTLQGSVQRAELADLLETSRTRNLQIGITGLLLVRDRRVMQILEGGEPEVRDLYGRIRRDPRHRDVTEVWSSTSTSRRFPEWSMGFEDLEIEPGAQAAVAGSPERATPHRLPLTSEQQTFLNRRMALLRRGLASGDRLISALSIIMDAHEAESVATGSGAARLGCRQGCKPDDRLGSDPGTDGYPCYTAQNAFWALDAVL